MDTQMASLRAKWNELKAQQPHLRIRNAAAALNVSEAELLATQCGEEVTRLRPEFQAILGEIHTLGKVMALTRNDSVVHERKGVYLNPTLNSPHMGLFVGEDIDLRIFFGPWDSAFAVTEAAKDKPRLSLQFFGKDGEAVHKIYLTPTSDVEAYETLVKKYTHTDQSAEQKVQPGAQAPAEASDSTIDVENFRNEWINLKDTHDFFGMLKKYNLSRTQALRLAPEGDYAIKVSNDTLRKIVTAAGEKEIPIMVFVGNKGMIQIHTGPVKKIVDMEGWFNVLDPDFNLHVKESDIEQSWIVRKPTVDGVVTALECFDKNGEQIVQIFGKRKPGIPELESWRTLVAEIEKN